MSKLSCICGNTIRDRTDDLPYKASFLMDVDYGAFFDWLTSETQSYVDAVRRNALDTWLLEKGFDINPQGLTLSDGEILHDHIHAYYLRLKRDAYRCTSCGRLYVQCAQSNEFVRYAPDKHETDETCTSTGSPSA